MASHISRGLAVGDLNNDGRPDVVVANINGPVEVLINQIQTNHQWLGLGLYDRNNERAMTQAVVWLLDEEGQRVYRRRSRTDGSYASAQDPRILMGLGEQQGPVSIEIHWPDGSKERHHSLETNQYHRITQGSGQPITE